MDIVSHNTKYKKRCSSSNAYFTLLWSKIAQKQFKELAPVVAEKVLVLIKAIQRNEDTGRPEFLRILGVHSRRITQKDRLTYCLTRSNLEICTCKGHYRSIQCSTLGTLVERGTAPQKLDH